jgi:CheY-like chemotaxis protein
MFQWQPIRVATIGPLDSFHQVLVANVQHWGYEVVDTAQTMPDCDIIVYDLDGSGDLSNPASISTIHQKMLAFQSLSSYNMQRSSPQFMILLSSRSVSRLTQEKLGAVALLTKPFEMGRLQRYLHVLQRLVLISKQMEAEEHLSLQSGSREQVRVLVVDDDHAMAQAVYHCLIGDSGYNVAMAHNGLDALEMCLDWQPHCLVTDLIMPWMNGNQVMRCLSVLTVQHMPAFVIMSALNRREGRGLYVYGQHQAVIYLDKPVEFDHLRTTVQQACIEQYALRA